MIFRIEKRGFGALYLCRRQNTERCGVLTRIAETSPKLRRREGQEDGISFLHKGEENMGGTG